MKKRKKERSFEREKPLDDTLVKRKIEQNIEVLDDRIIFKGNNDNVQSLFILIYNSFRDHPSFIYKFWSYQILHSLHRPPELKPVAIKALKT